MNGKWPYSVFAPKGAGQAQANPDTLSLILKELKEIKALLSKQEPVDSEPREDEPPF
jgi:hypothetical protein